MKGGAEEQAMLPEQTTKRETLTAARLYQQGQNQQR